MPPNVTTRFGADFSSFYDAVQNATVKLRTFEEGAGKAQGQLNRLANAFSGQKVVADATLMVEAIERLGGATKLTAAEQAKVNAQLTEAIEKYKVLGQTAPKAMTDLAEATKRTATATESVAPPVSTMTSNLKSMAGALGIAFSVQTVINFGRELLTTADSLATTADRLSITIAEVQKLQYIAKLSGTSLENMTSALAFMQEAIGSQSAGLLAVTNQLGISFGDLRQQSPYEQMITLAKGIGAIQDPAEKAAAAGDAFGKSWRTILPALTEDIETLGNQTHLMSETAVKGFDAIGDALPVLWDGFKAGIANAFDPIFERFNQFPAEAQKAKDGLASVGLSVDGLTADVKDLILQWDLWRGKGTIAPLPTVPGSPLAPQKPKPLSMTPEEVAALERELTRLYEAQGENAKAADQHAKALEALKAQLFGEGAIKAAQDYVTALGPLSNLTRVSEEDQRKMNLALGLAIAAYTRLGEVAPQAMRDLYTATIPLPPIVEGLGAVWANVGEKVVLPTVDKIIAKMKEIPDQEAKNQAFYAEIDAMSAKAFGAVATSADKGTAAVTKQATAVEQLVLSFQKLSSAQLDAEARALEWDAAQNRMRGGGGAFWSSAQVAGIQEAQARSLQQKAGVARGREAFLGGGTTNYLGGVTVQGATSDQQAQAFIDSLRRQGIRL